MIACTFIRCVVKSPRLCRPRCIPKQPVAFEKATKYHTCSRLVRSSLTSATHSRFFSSSIVVAGDNNNKKNASLQHPNAVRILFGSQGGTAQIFAMQLSEELEELDVPVEVMAMNEASTPVEHLQPDKALHVFLISVAGVGEPPNNAREFYNWLMDEKNSTSISNVVKGQDNQFGSLQYAVFGLGNQKAHPNHYNVIGKHLDQRLEELGGTRVLPLGLGDDGECLEDDFDTWRDQFVKMITKQKIFGNDDSHEIEREVHEDDEQVDFASVVMTEQQPPINSVHAPQKDTTATAKASRRTNDKYPVLQLQKNESRIACRGDLCFLQNSAKPFYQEGTSKLAITANRLLSANAGESGLRELQISLKGEKTQRYEAGDHLIVYPSNSGSIVEAYLHILDVDPNTRIDEPETGPSRQRAYPHPVGITLQETLTHCVDLGSSPSPSFSRMILGRPDVDYREEIVDPRRTALDLIHESGHLPALEELLYNLPPMKPRYYSIASSALVHPDEVFITYRPVKYYTSRGYLREGVCTSYMSHLGVGETSTSHIMAGIRSNPTFRLPKDRETPILMIAGGCGIAPIRAFLEERIAMAAGSTKFGKGHLYLGFRNPSDEVYRPMIQQAQDCGAITDVKVSYSTGCTSPALVSTTVRENGAEVFALVQDGGYVYMCGGARAFGAAVEMEILSVFQEHGKMSLDEATNHLRKLISEGRLCEDLAD